ncbi:MAG: HTTM domain-containing protein, partial [Planctomycetales bacterium]
GVYYWSHLLWIESPATLWIAHLAALAVMAMLVVGFFSRTCAVLTFLITVSYMHRATGALFGLDQINVMLAMYLMVGPCGARYSIDRWLASRKQGNAPVADSVAGNIAIRLIQIHMCVIYFFAGTRKLMGDTWWDGSAMWYSIANYEYQSVDMTWLVAWPMAIAVLTHVTILFEVSYCVLIWNRLTRPVMLTLAVVLHLGIAMCMGMATFGLAMLIGNLAFISSPLVRAVVERKKTSPARQQAASNPGN